MLKNPRIFMINIHGFDRINVNTFIVLTLVRKTFLAKSVSGLSKLGKSTTMTIMQMRIKENMCTNP